MRLAMFCHSLISDWNHGNAHFLRGIATELLSRGHDVRVYEPRGAWSLRNLVAERNTAVQLRFDDDGLTLDAGHGDEALATELIDAQVKGEGITTGFNPQFLLDGLTAIEAPVVELAFTQASKPAVMAGVATPDGEADLDFRYLLMPRRLLS